QDLLQLGDASRPLAPPNDRPVCVHKKQCRIAPDTELRLHRLVRTVVAEEQSVVDTELAADILDPPYRVGRRAFLAGDADDFQTARAVRRLQTDQLRDRLQARS